MTYTYSHQCAGELWCFLRSLQERQLNLSFKFNKLSLKEKLVYSVAEEHSEKMAAENNNGNLSNLLPRRRPTPQEQAEGKLPVAT